MHWFWYFKFGCGRFVKEGVGGFWTCRGRLLALAPVVHGVAGDGHWRCHGDSWAAHGELVGDRVMRTAAAGTLLSSCGPCGEKRILYACNVHNYSDQI